METTTMRVTLKTKQLAEKMAHDTNTSAREIIEKAIESYQKQQLLKSANTAYAALRSNPEAWEDYQNEIAEWDATLADGLEAE